MTRGCSSVPDTAAEQAATVRAGAHFYMAHKMREYPHPNAPEITMAEHSPNDPDCPGCKAEAALAALVARCEQAERIIDDDDALNAAWRRAEAAERLVQQLQQERDEWQPIAAKHLEETVEECRKWRLRAEAAERRVQQLETALPRADLPTVLDVARTHVEIIVRKGREYTDVERANVAQITLDSIAEVRAELMRARAALEGDNQ